LIAAILADLAPIAYEAGLSPSDFRAATFQEVRDWLHAAARRQARAQDARAWAVAHLMLATGNYARSLTLPALMRDLLGREPGTLRRVDGHEEDSRARLSVEASIAHMKAWTQTASRQTRRGT
jgi:hypothetical protein